MLFSSTKVNIPKGSYPFLFPLVTCFFVKALIVSSYSSVTLFSTSNPNAFSLFEEKMGVFVENLQQIIKDENSASEKLKQMVENHFRVLANDRHLATVTQLELRQSNKEIRLKINAVLKNYLLLLDQILIEGMVSGEFNPSMDVRIARQMVFGTIDEISTTWVMNEYRYDLMELAPKVQKVLLNGLRA